MVKGAMCVPCEYCGCLDSYSGALCEAGSVQRERETEIVQLTTLSHSYRAHTNIHMTTNIHCYTQKIMFLSFPTPSQKNTKR